MEEVLYYDLFRAMWSKVANYPFTLSGVQYEIA